MTTVERFRAWLAGEEPPAALSPAGRALWLDGKGRWAEAHEQASQIPGEVGARVHAYLHRKEGDLANAGYWYQRAGRAPATGSIEEEWQALVGELVEGRA